MTDAHEVARLVDVVKSVYVAESVQQYAVALTTATRRSADLRLGASPRATLHLVRAARASAALDGRDYVTPDDVQILASAVLAHRLLPNVEAHLAGRSSERIIADIVRGVPTPERHPRPAGGR